MSPSPSTNKKSQPYSCLQVSKTSIKLRRLFPTPKNPKKRPSSSWIFISIQKWVSSHLPISATASVGQSLYLKYQLTSPSIRLIMLPSELYCFLSASLAIKKDNPNSFSRRSNVLKTASWSIVSPSIKSTNSVECPKASEIWSGFKSCSTISEIAGESDCCCARLCSATILEILKCTSVTIAITTTANNTKMLLCSVLNVFTDCACSLA